MITSGSGASHTYMTRRQVHDCIDDVVNDRVTKVNNPRLTAYHEKRELPQVAELH